MFICFLSHFKQNLINKLQFQSDSFRLMYLMNY